MVCTATGVHPEQIWCMPTAIWLALLPFHLHHLCSNLTECSFLDNLLLPIKPKLYFTSQELYNCQASLVCCLPLRISTTQSTTWFTMHQSNLELANTSCLHHRRGFSLIKAFSSRCTSTLHWLTPCHITRTCDLLLHAPRFEAHTYTCIFSSLLHIVLCRHANWGPPTAYWSPSAQPSATLIINNILTHQIPTAQLLLFQD